MTSTTRELVDFMRHSYGGSVVSKKVNAPNHSKTWAWKLSGRKAWLTMERVLPFLREPVKAARAAYILANYDLVTKRNGKYAPDELEAKLKFESRFFELYPTSRTPVGLSKGR
jgi:hypothetical protein